MCGTNSPEVSRTWDHMVKQPPIPRRKNKAGRLCNRNLIRQHFSPGKNISRVKTWDILPIWYVFCGLLWMKYGGSSNRNLKLSRLHRKWMYYLHQLTSKKTTSDKSVRWGQAFSSTTWCKQKPIHWEKLSGSSWHPQQQHVEQKAAFQATDGAMPVTVVKGNSDESI